MLRVIVLVSFVKWCSKDVDSCGDDLLVCGLM